MNIIFDLSNNLKLIIMSRIEKLEQYFNLSKEHYMIGNCQLLVDKPYIQKVDRLNEIYSALRKLEKEL